MNPSSTALLNRLLARGKFRHVQVLLKLAELGSVQRTADAIGMTQSSVTQTLAYLERLLETQLFHRHARGVRPTPACTDLLPVARNVLLGVTEGAEVIAARRNQGQGIVRLVASAAATNGLLIQVLPQFNDRFPAIQVHLREAEGEDLLLSVARGEVDLVACRRPAVVPEGWQFQALLEDSFVVACAADHPLAKARRVDWAELASETWLLPPAGSLARTQFDELASRFAQMPPTYPLVTRTLTAMWWLLRHRGVLGFVPLGFVRHLVDARELAVVPVSEAIPMEPLGLLQPATGSAEAATRLCVFLRDFFLLAAPAAGSVPAGTRRRPRPASSRPTD